jgi:diguanylate cyclase
VDRFSLFNAPKATRPGPALAELALLIKNNLRLSDLAFRFDGATFAILAPQTSAEGAAVIGDKLRRLVKGYSFGRKPLTASLGAATLAGDDDREQLLSRALRALQQAKTNGRDCLVLEPA